MSQAFTARIDADGRIHLDQPEAWRHHLRRFSSSRVELLIHKPMPGSEQDPELPTADPVREIGNG